MCETTHRCVSSRGPDDDHLTHPEKDRVTPPELDHPHRERLFRHLQGRDASVHLADLARELARPIALDGGERRRTETDADSIYVMLYHDHVPRLADAGIVEFDREEKTVWLANRRDADCVPAD